MPSTTRFTLALLLGVLAGASTASAQGSSRSEMAMSAPTTMVGGQAMFPTPRLISYGLPMPIERVLEVLEPSWHGALDPVEGAVWRVERLGKVDFLAKYVRPTKIDGLYLFDWTDGQPVDRPEERLVWNWWPGRDDW